MILTVKQTLNWNTEIQPATYAALKLIETSRSDEFQTNQNYVIRYKEILKKTAKMKVCSYTSPVYSYLTKTEVSLPLCHWQ